MRILIPILSLYFVSNLALAEPSVYFKTTQAECRTVDLIASAPIAIQDSYRSFNRQGDLNWCYAYSAADLLTWEFKVPASAAYVAIKNNDNLNFLSRSMRGIGKTLFGMNKIVPEYGLSEDGLQLGLKKGICPLEILPSDNPSIREIDNEIVQLQSAITASRAAEKKGCPDLPELTKLFPTQDLQEIINVAADVHHTDVQQILNRLADNACRNKLLISPIKKRVVSFESSQENLVDAINDHLSAIKPSPISLVINPEVFSDKSKSAGSSLMTHVVTVLVRRFNEKKHSCEYLVKDSNGSSACDTYAKNLECKDSHYWIEDDMIHRGAWTVTYVEQ